MLAIFRGLYLTLYAVYYVGFMATNNKQALLITQGKLAQMLLP
jgi:hypothetical protein